MSPRIRFLLLLFLALLPSLVISQEISISAHVNDTSYKAISFANVLLLTVQDSTLVKGVSTNENGYFNFSTVTPDAYILKVSFLGYNDFYKSIVVDKSQDLGVIKLQESLEELNEVNLSFKRPTLKKMADRLIFNVENTAVIEGTMFDVIKNTPGILVMENSVLVKNKRPNVYINGKKVHLSGDDLIQLLQGSAANSVKSVEVITNPSAKYDASAGAVINIIMGKNLITGYRGNVSGNFTQGVYPRYNAGMGHFFKNEKVDFFANYMYSQNKIQREQEGLVNYLDNANTVQEIFESKTSRTTWSKTHNLNFNLDYSINENNTLSLSSKMMVMPDFKYYINNDTEVFDPNRSRDFYFNAFNKSNDKKYNIGFDLDFVHQFDNAGETLRANAHFTTYDYERRQGVVSKYYADDSSFLDRSDYRTNNLQDTQIATASVDYTLPLGDSSTLIVGGKGSTISTNSDITQYTITNGSETVDPNNTNAYNYDESIFAGYANYSQKWDNVNLDLGLRAEQTHTTGKSIKGNVKNSQNYLEWFPTANLSYEFSDNFTLYTTTKRSIKRPSYQDLNPFQFYLNDYTIVTGNPELEPVIVQRNELGTSLLKGLFTVELFYQSSKNNIFELTLQDNDNTIIRYTPLNLNSTVEYGLDFETYFNVLDNWSIYFANSIFNVKDSGIVNNTKLERQRWTNYSQISTDATFLKDRSLTANLSVTYMGNTIYGFTEMSSVVFSNLSVSKSILKNKATLSLLITDIVNQQDFKFKSKYLNQDNISTFNEDTRTIKLGFRYKFGNTNLETNQRTNEQQETDRLEKK